MPKRPGFTPVVVLGLLLFLVFIPSAVGEPRVGCTTIHARAQLYGGDGQLRIWHIGTHHEYEPDSESWQRVLGWLQAGVTDRERAQYATPASMVSLYGDFLVCPTEQFRKGAVQQADVKTVTHRRYEHLP